MAKPDLSRFDTTAIHAGQTPDPVTKARAQALYRTTSFVFDNVAHAARLFALQEFGNIYTRLGNPTNDVLESRVSALEGAAASVSVASGTAAIFNTVITIAKAGDEIVSASNLYGGTYTMFDAILPDLGITTRFADIHNIDSFESAITDKTRLIFAETIGNPALDVADIDALSALAKRHRLPLVIDATFTTPCLLRSIEHGANIVINSLSKWMGGHGTAIGGTVSDAGNFDWADPRFELFNRPDPNYHGLRWAQDLPDELKRIAFALRFRTVPLRNLGACLSPDNAWLFLQGLETLPLRMARHVANAQAVAQFLKKHPKVAWVRYPGLEGDPSKALADRLLTKGAGGMVVFGVRASGAGTLATEVDAAEARATGAHAAGARATGARVTGAREAGAREAGTRFIESLRLFSHLANVGDAKSLALHPASTSHSQLSEAQQLASGLRPDLVRLSIGLEDINDILSDLDSALQAV